MNYSEFTLKDSTFIYNHLNEFKISQLVHLFVYFSDKLNKREINFDSLIFIKIKVIGKEIKIPFLTFKRR